MIAGILQNNAFNCQSKLVAIIISIKCIYGHYIICTIAYYLAITRHIIWYNITF